MTVKNPQTNRTTRVPEEELRPLRAAKQAYQGAQLSLVIYSRDGIRVAPLVDGERLVIGRSHPADVQIRDGTLSRSHATIELRSGEVWLEDLSSTNGTFVDGDRIERVKVPVSAGIAFGAVTASIQPYSAFGASLHELDSHDRFMVELDAEVRRSLAHGHSMALLMVRSARRSGSPLNRWFPLVRQYLRPYDRAALYSASMIEILVPEADDVEVTSLATSIAHEADSLRCGFGYLSPRAGSAEALLEQVRNAVQQATSSRPVMGAPQPMDSTVEPSGAGGASQGPVVKSAAMRKVFGMVKRVASSSIPVLLRGETGTGKEVIARAIHEGGKRRSKPLIPVNCGAIPSQLVEATLFGHEKGAFTGANAQSKGVFESADGGTVLLDEIGELPASAQAALLRVLETMRITRVGSTREIDIDVRVLAATHRDLEEMSHDGTFRSDLLYRLDGMTILIPPLRQRQQDLLPLLERFIEMANAVNDCDVSGVDDEAMDLLRRYEWPGNIRELRNAVERAVVIAQGDLISIDDLPAKVRELRPSQRSEGPHDEDESELPTPSGPIDLKDAVKQYEVKLILNALREAAWDRNVAAQALSIPTRTLSHKMQTYNIKRVFRAE